MKHYNSVIHIAGIMTMSDVDMQRRFEVKIHPRSEIIFEEHEIPHTVKIFKGDNCFHHHGLRDSGECRSYYHRLTRRVVVYSWEILHSR